MKRRKGHAEMEGLGIIECVHIWFRRRDHGKTGTRGARTVRRSMSQLHVNVTERIPVFMTSGVRKPDTNYSSSFPRHTTRCI